MILFSFEQKRKQKYLQLVCQRERGRGMVEVRQLSFQRANNDRREIGLFRAITVEILGFERKQ